MKRTTIILSLIFALAIALSVSIPTLAAESGTTTVTGALAPKIDVTAPSGFALTLDPAASPATGTATAGNVKANKDGWTVTVTGDHASMYSATLVDGLDADFQVNIGSGLVDIDTAPTLTGSKTGGSGVSIPLSVSQAVSWDDEAASDYQIVITFTGSY